MTRAEAVAVLVVASWADDGCHACALKQLERLLALLPGAPWLEAMEEVHSRKARHEEWYDSKPYEEGEPMPKDIPHGTAAEKMMTRVREWAARRGAQ